MTPPAPSRALFVCGAPASGKSSFGRELARHLRCAVLDLDTMTNPLFEHLGGEILVDTAKEAAPGRPAVNAVRYECLYDTAAEVLSLGTSVVAIAPFTSERSDPDAWATVSERLGIDASRVTLAWVDTPAAEIATRRLRRAADRDLGALERALDGLPPEVIPAPAAPHIRVDGLLSVEEQIIAFQGALARQPDEARLAG